MIPRHISTQLLESLSDSPVVLLHGARQTGKSTLVKHLSATSHPSRYITLDDTSVLSATDADPAGFIAGLEGPVALDEVQRAPGLFLAIKADVDRNRRPGRYLLTGSANVLALPKLSETLAGRMEILTLWPFSQGEMDGHRETFIDNLFEGQPAVGIRPQTAGDLVERILRGGYPEACRRPSWQRRRAWFNSYITTLLQRDVRDLANIEGLTAMPRLLGLLASRIGSLVNQAELARSLGMPQTTLKRYLALLEATFLVQLLPPWSSNLGKRLVKSPKLYLSDTGLAASLLGKDSDEGLKDLQLLGPLVENFVVMELRKQITWSCTQPAMFHFRTLAGHEVDVVLESAAGKIAGIEVKAGASVRASDFRGLRLLAEQTGNRFAGGVVFYTGSAIVPFGPSLHAMPLPALWQG
ncbi:MAG TPA: ATP-binding protein [Phycisphaerae bacterium]|nr:ATP-binding protein [Phycisphaerae bacterium]